MWELLKELLKQETFLVIKYRAKGLTVMKPSSIALIVFSIMFLILGLRSGSMFGYIVTVVVLSLVAMIVYGDIGGVFVNEEVRPKSVPLEEKSDGPIIFPGTDRSSDHLIPVPDSVSRERSADSLESYIRNNALHIDDERSVTTNSDETAKPLDIYAHFLSAGESGTTRDNVSESGNKDERESAKRIRDEDNKSGI
jgi:hypothetical protein